MTSLFKRNFFFYIKYGINTYKYLYGYILIYRNNKSSKLIFIISMSTLLAERVFKLRYPVIVYMYRMCVRIILYKHSFNLGYG